MENQNLIHVKLDYDELIISKKEVLSTEANLIRILQIMKKYNTLRTKELNLKSKFLRKLKNTKTQIKKLEQTLPKLEIPEEDIPSKKTSRNIKPKKDNLKLELEEIQKKLKKLER